MSKEYDISESLCATCVFRFSRTIITDNYEEFGVDIDEIDLESGDEVVIEQNVCMVTDIELDDHIVLNCNKFINESTNDMRSLIFHGEFRDK